jgi:holin (3TMs family)
MSFDPFTALFSLGNTVLEKFIPDANLREQAARQLASEINLQVMGQIELNKVEAASPSFWIAGWRPALAWMCVVSFAYAGLLHDVANWGLKVAGVVTMLPNPDTSTTFDLLLGMLGLGGMRTFEKMKGLTK